MARGKYTPIDDGNPAPGNPDEIGEPRTIVVDPGDFDRDLDGTSGTGTGSDTAAERTPTGRIKRKRGPNKPKASLDLDGLSGILLNIHGMLAAMTETPELVLAPQEAEELAKAIQANARHYNIPAVGPKVLDGINLAMVLVTIYGGRFAAIRLRMNAAPSPQPSPPAPREPARPGVQQVLVTETYQHLQ